MFSCDTIMCWKNQNLKSGVWGQLSISWNQSTVTKIVTADFSDGTHIQNQTHYKITLFSPRGDDFERVSSWDQLRVTRAALRNEAWRRKIYRISHFIEFTRLHLSRENTKYLTIVRDSATEQQYSFSRRRESRGFLVNVLNTEHDLNAIPEE